MNWHYVEQGKQLGPVNDDWILELERSGKINANTLVWREGMADWKPLRDVRSELKRSGMTVVGPAAASGNPSPETAYGTQGPEAVCGECGKMFPVDEMIRHGNVRICASCKPIFMQKLSEGANVNPDEMRYAGFWIRLVAKVLDSLILGVIMVVIFGIAAALLVPLLHGNPDSGAAILIFGVLALVMLVVHFSYLIWFVGKYGATPGKMICRLKIVSAEGRPVGYWLATGRLFAEMLSALVLDIGYIIAAFDREKRALHDHICKTRVIYK